MRNDNMITTALAAREDDVSARIAKWRQLVDLLAQAGPAIAPDLRASAEAAVERLRADVPRDQRRRAGEALAGRGDSLELFANEDPAVAAPLLMRAQLTAAAWRALIPRLPKASRALLRNRRDLPGEVMALLESFGPADLALTTSVEAVPTEQIRELVARIEAFRQTRTLPHMAEGVSIGAFSFETDADGVIAWVEGAPRAALIGLQIAEAALAGGYGVDGHVAGAFRRRAPFREARMLLAAGPAAGAWRLTGGPVFNRMDGRFAGYRVDARRPRPDEAAEPLDLGNTNPFHEGSIRPLLHELRTPLNAILGFAAMIEQQLLGPVHAAHRVRAARITAEGLRLSAMLDDLEAVVGRLPSNDPDAHFAELLEAMVERQDGIAAARGARVLVEQNGLQAEPATSHAIIRALERMVTALAVHLEAGEALIVSLRADSGNTEVAVSLPRHLAALTIDERLERNGGDSDADMPPRLGLGFAIRLFETAVRRSGGRLVHLPDRLIAVLGSERLRDTNAQ